MTPSWRDRVIAAEVRGSFLPEDVNAADRPDCCLIGEAVARLGKCGIRAEWREVNLAVKPDEDISRVSIGGAAGRLVRENQFALVHRALDAIDDYILTRKRELVA